MSDYGTVVAPDTVFIERLLPGPIERVWQYLVDPEKRSSWLAAGPMALHTGGAVELVFHNNRLTGHDDPPPEKFAAFGGEVRQSGHITACEPTRLLAYTWGDSSEVRFELDEEGGRVRLQVTHSRLANRDAMVNVSGGWHTHLDVLAARLNDRAPESFWVAFARREAEYSRSIPR